MLTHSEHQPGLIPKPHSLWLVNASHARKQAPKV